MSATCARAHAYTGQLSVAPMLDDTCRAQATPYRVDWRQTAMSSEPGPLIEMVARLCRQVPGLSWKIEDPDTGEIVRRGVH